MADDVFGIVGSLQDGAFRVEEVVAEGGFAVVYRAHHQGFRAHVALKCLKIPGMLTQAKQAEFLEKFRAEGELLFRLSAAIPAVVRPLHLGTLESPRVDFVPFIALEWLAGRNLDAFIAERRARGKPPLGLGRAVQLLAPAARALQQAHRFAGPEGFVSILHRDLKPENLFVTELHGRETIKVLDFGIGKVKRTATQLVGRTSIEQSTISAFTPCYGAPEQWLPKRFGQSGTWTDIWGLALTLVELVTGRTPLDGDAHAVMGAAIDATLRPTPRAFGIATSDDIEAIFQKALAVDPKDRYHRIGEFWDHLETALGLSDTRVWATPSHVIDLPSARPPSGPLPRLPRRDAGEAARALDLEIPDLESSLLPDPPPRSRRRAAAPSPPPSREATEDFDEFAASPPGSGEVDAIPNIGGFRMDPADRSPPDSLELSTSLAELRARPAVARHVQLVTPSHRSLGERVGGPLKLLAVAALITALDWVYTSETGEALQVGPARAFWIAGPLAVLAIVKLVYRLIEH